MQLVQWPGAFKNKTWISKEETIENSSRREDQFAVIRGKRDPAEDVDRKRSTRTRCDYHREITHAGILEDDDTKTSLMRPLKGLKSKVGVTFTFGTKEFVFYSL